MRYNQFYCGESWKHTPCNFWVSIVLDIIEKEEKKSKLTHRINQRHILNLVHDYDKGIRNLLVIRYLEEKKPVPSYYGNPKFLYSVHVKA